MSDGVAAVRQLLVAHAPLIALVPNWTPQSGPSQSRIIAGRAGIGTPLPVVTLKSIGKYTRNTLKRGAYRFVEQRVQATVQALDYVSQKAIIDVVRDAGDSKFPTVSGLRNVTVHLRDGGADLSDEEASFWVETQDFWVTFSEPR